MKKIPSYLVVKLQLWVDLFEEEGLLVSRKIKSFHDEPLLGKRKGQRSIRLNKAYRMIYVEKNSSTNKLIEILEVNKHDY